MTRTHNSLLNLITGTVSTGLVILLNFIVRSVFIRYLGDSFLGIEGLFTNILSMLSLAELGFGSAIVFRLYKPIEENDRPRIKVLMKLYRRTYFVIGWVVVILGVCLIPFLPWIVRDYDTLAPLGLNASVVFLLYLFNSAASYWFFAYKSAFVQATQKTYLLTVMSYAVSIVCCLAQIGVLILTRNFILYVVVSILFVLVKNLLYARICDKRHPYLREPTEERISKEEVKEFFKDCSALFLYRVSNVVIGGSDSIVLSSMLGLRAVAVYTNIYGTIRLNLQNLLYNFISAIQASLGSIYSTGNLDWSRLIFRVVNFCTVWLFGVGAIGIAILSNDFITLWVGRSFVVTSWTTANGVNIATPVALLAGIETFVTGQKYYCGSFRNAMGLFQQLKYRPVLSVIVNLFFSITLVPYLGIASCLVSTIIAALTVNLIVDPLIIYKHALKQSPKGYFARNIFYKIVVIAAGILSWWLCKLAAVGGILGFLIHGVICVTVPSAIFVLLFWRTTEFRFLINTAKSLLPGRLRPSGPDTAEEEK